MTAVTLLATGLGSALAISAHFPPWLITLTTCLSASSAALLFASTSSQVDMRLVAYNLLRAAPPALGLATAVALALAGHLTVSTMLLGQVAVGTVCFFVGIRWLTDKLESRRPIERPRSLWLYIRLGGAYHGTAVLGLLINNIDKIYLAFQHNIYQFGLYSSVYGISRLISTGQNAIGTAIFARFAGGTEDAVDTVARAFRITFLPMLLVATTLSLAANPLVTFLLGDPFLPGVWSLRVLLFEAVLSGSAWMLAQQFNAYGRPGAVLFRQLVSVVPLLAGLWFVPSQHAALALSLLMLASGFLRLAATIVLYRRIFNTDRLRILVKTTDLMWLWGRLRFESRKR